MDITNLRLNYSKSSIDFNGSYNDPIKFFLDWFTDSLKLNKSEANSCVLSTVTKENHPTSRVVLLKFVNNNGFTFFTNYDSNKSKDIILNPNVSLNFFWPELERQVRISGTAKKTTECISDEYFNSRPRESQIGALASNQSKTIDSDHDFNKIINILNDKFKDIEITRPSNWGGYCVNPTQIEFWQGRPSRLHDRLLFVIKDDKWVTSRLSS